MILPKYSYVGVAILAISELAMALHVEPFWTFHTAFAWTGYILLVDGIVFRVRGSSWLTSHLKEFVFLAAVSVPLWVVFEGYNRLIRNWHYVNLPEQPAARYFGYAWAFATIWPAIFETAELVGLIVGQRSANVDRLSSNVDRRSSKKGRQWSLLDGALVVVGAAMLIWPLARPSPYHAALVFLGFIFLLDPINRRLAGDSIFAGIDNHPTSRRQRALNLLVAGLVCGVLWEFWNYWARAKWIYDVPIMQDWKIFEMPLPGYFGFPPFAVECFTMYVFVRHLIWRGRVRAIAL